MPRRFRLRHPHCRTPRRSVKCCRPCPASRRAPSRLGVCGSTDTAAQVTDRGAPAPPGDPGRRPSGILPGKLPIRSESGCLAIRCRSRRVQLGPHRSRDSSRQADHRPYGGCRSSGHGSLQRPAGVGPVTRRAAHRGAPISPVPPRRRRHQCGGRRRYACARPNTVVSSFHGVSRRRSAPKPASCHWLKPDPGDRPRSPPRDGVCQVEGRGTGPRRGTATAAIGTDGARSRSRPRPSGASDDQQQRDQAAARRQSDRGDGGTSTLTRDAAHRSIFREATDADPSMADCVAAAVPRSAATGWRRCRGSTSRQLARHRESNRLGGRPRRHAPKPTLFCPSRLPRRRPCRVSALPACLSSATDKRFGGGGSGSDRFGACWTAGEPR